MDGRLHVYNLPLPFQFLHCYQIMLLVNKGIKMFSCTSALNFCNVLLKFIVKFGKSKCLTVEKVVIAV